MPSEIRQSLSSISFPETTVFSDRYEEIQLKPGATLQFNFDVRSATPVSCVFADPDAIKLSPIHFQVERGGGVSYIPVYEGKDITDTASPQILEKLR